MDAHHTPSHLPSPRHSNVVGALRSVFILSFVLLLLSISACATKTSEQLLHGVWVIDQEATMAQVVPGEERVLDERFETLKLVLEFNPDGTFRGQMELSGDLEDQAGTYTVTQVEEDSVVFDMAQPGDRTYEIHVTFLNKDLIRYSPGNRARDATILKRIRKNGFARAIE